jgi:hypothetical protein
MYEGHMTPLPVLRHAPIRWQRSAAARMPPGNDSRVVSGTGAGSWGSRRFSVMAGASTITPGFRRPSGSKSAFTLRNAS